MNREQLKELGVAAADRGNARFLDEGDVVDTGAVVFAPLDGVFTVYTTDMSGRPVERTRRSFTSDSDALDYMYDCLRERVSERARPNANSAANLIAAYRQIGFTGALTSILLIATAVGWLWISPFIYTRADTLKPTISSDERGEFVFDAESGLPVVAICYTLAVLNMWLQWSLGRHDTGSIRRRSVGVAIGTAAFSVVALVCMFIRSGEIENPFFWFPPLLALGGALAVMLILGVPRARSGAPAEDAAESSPTPTPPTTPRTLSA